jgi:hypothetical protein
MTFITHGFRGSVVSDVRERVRDLGSRLRLILNRSSLVECSQNYYLYMYMFMRRCDSSLYAVPNPYYASVSELFMV